MKNIVLSLFCFALLFTSCNDKKKEDANASPITLGKKLFSTKTCTTCHAVDTKTIGPSIKTMVKIYNEKSGNIVEFLKGNAAPIVDTDPTQIAIMKANLDGFVKDMSQKELEAIVAYMQEVAD